MHNIRTYENTISISELHLQLNMDCLWSCWCFCRCWRWGSTISTPRMLGPSARPRARGRRRADCDNTAAAAASSQHINCNNTSQTQWKAKPRNIKSIRFLPFLPLLGSFFVGSTIFKKIFGRYFLVCLNCCRRPCTTPSPGHQRSQM